MHDNAPHEPDTRHPLAQQAAETKGRIKRPQRTDNMMNDVPRGSETELREAGRGRKV